jgi:hypothetical protein
MAAATDYHNLNTFIQKYSVDDAQKPDTDDEMTEVRRLLDTVELEAAQKLQRWQELSLYVGRYHKEIVTLAARYGNQGQSIANALRLRHSDLAILSESMLTQIVAEYMQALRDRAKALRSNNASADSRIIRNRVPDTTHRFFRELRQDSDHYPFADYALRGKVYLNPQRVQEDAFKSLCRDFDTTSQLLAERLSIPHLENRTPPKRFMEDRGLAFKYLLQRTLHRSCVIASPRADQISDEIGQGQSFYKLTGAFEHYHEGIVAEVSLVGHLLSVMALDRLKRRTQCAGVLLNKHGVLLKNTYNRCYSALKDNDTNRLSKAYNLHLHGFGIPMLDERVNPVFTRYGEWN